MTTMEEAMAKLGIELDARGDFHSVLESELRENVLEQMDSGSDHPDHPGYDPERRPNLISPL